MMNPMQRRAPSRLKIVSFTVYSERAALRLTIRSVTAQAMAVSLLHNTIFTKASAMKCAPLRIIGYANLPTCFLGSITVCFQQNNANLNIA